MQVFALALLAAVPAAGPDFDTEVLPVLTRAGCNGGACHGSAAGRGGFRLSLWGSDPRADHESIVREFEGRRVNLARPERSLLLRKATRQVGHGGGLRFAEDSPSARRLLDWVKAGAPRERRRRLATFAVTPDDAALARQGETVSLRALASFDDGSREDVTAWAVFRAADPGAAEVSPSGRVRVLRRGPHAVLVRYLHETRAVRLTVPLGDRPVDLSREARHNFIDGEVLAGLQTLRVAPAPLCDDATFLRRVRLDLTGTLPSPDEVRAFLADTSPDRRARLVERLLASSAFTEFWTLKWGHLLGISSRPLGKEAARAFHDWVREQVARNSPLGWMAREMLTAVGDSGRVGPASFSRIPAGPREQAEHVSRVFLGVRLGCANCHDHPLDRWTQDDYHGLAAVFARLQRGPVVRVMRQGDVIHPRTGEPAVPRLPGERFLDAGADGREALAAWLTRPDNPYFARAAANRLWREMMGRGLVEPVDDLRDTNPATHPRLLGRLAEDFTRGGHDVRRILRLIANSATYQRAGREGGQGGGEGGAEAFYPRALRKPLGAEVLADALADVTGVAEVYGDLPRGTRAVTLHDSRIPSEALDVLGRCSRAGPCEGEAAGKGGLARTLHLINGPLLNRKVTAPEGRLRTLLASGASNVEVVEEFYLRTLSRPPTKAERAHWDRQLDGAGGEARREVLEDFLWALLSSREFTTNH